VRKSTLRAIVIAFLSLSAAVVLADKAREGSSAAEQAAPSSQIPSAPTERPGGHESETKVVVEAGAIGDVKSLPNASVLCKSQSSSQSPVGLHSLFIDDCAECTEASSCGKVCDDGGNVTTCGAFGCCNTVAAHRYRVRGPVWGGPDLVTGGVLPERRVRFSGVPEALP
jgi:hypothetical protein